MKFSNPFKKSSGSNDNFSQSVTSFNYSPGNPGNSSQSYSSSNTGVSSSSSSSTASTAGVQQVNTYTSDQSIAAPVNDSVSQDSQDSIATPVTSDTYSYEGFPVTSDNSQNNDSAGSTNNTGMSEAESNTSNSYEGFPVGSPSTESQVVTSYDSSINNTGVLSNNSVTTPSTPAVTNQTVITETGADGVPGAINSTSTNVNTNSVSPSPMIIDDSSESYVNGNGTAQVGVTNTDSGGQSADSVSGISAAPTNLTQDQIQAIVLNSIETVGSRFDNIPPEYISQLTDSINSSIQNMGNVELASAGTDAASPDLNNANVSPQNDQTANDSPEPQTVTSFNSDPGDSGNSSHSSSSSDSGGYTSIPGNSDAQNTGDSSQGTVTDNNITQDGQDLTAAVDNSDTSSYEDTQSSNDDSQQSTAWEGDDASNPQSDESGSTYENADTSYEGFPVAGDDSQAVVWDDTGSTPGDGSTSSFDNTDPSYEGFPESSTYPPVDNYDAQAANSDHPENWGSTADVPPDPMNNVMPASDDSQSSHDA